MEDFFVVTGVPPSQQAASARLTVDIAVRRELFPPGSPRDISWDELKRRIDHFRYRPLWLPLH
ncbi:hypothetical protein T09_4041 [Trichinella sp. T9]|nr:hypothetical protein T09_4041 [Trichinella sp. T9]